MDIFKEIKKELNEQLSIDETYVTSEFDEYQSVDDRFGFVQEYITI